MKMKQKQQPALPLLIEINVSENILSMYEESLQALLYKRACIN
jgi:hypothetical protein